MNVRATPHPHTTDTPLAQLLFNHSREPMWVLDVTGAVVRANEAARAAFTTRRPVFVELLDQALDHELPRTGSWTATIPVVGDDDDEVRMSATMTSMDDDAAHYLCVLHPGFEGSGDEDGPMPRTASDAQNDNPAMMWMAGPDMRREWFSKPWLDFTGESLEAQRGEGWMASIHPEDLERLHGIMAASTQARYPFTLDYRLRRHDGSWRWVMDSGLPRHAGDGSFRGYVGSCIDIHERKELEDRLAERTRALRLADRRKDEFLAMLSHELRNPLAPIANAAGLLRLMEKDNAPLGRVRVIVERQVEQLRRLINEMVDMTRLTQHRISLRRETLRVGDLVQKTLDAEQARIEAGGHSVRIDMPDPSVEIEADPARLQQALGNLIANAAKFMQHPDVIHLRTEVRDRTLAIHVRDRGDGIAADFLPHVFELFAQQDQSLARVHGGLGIGLTIARRIVQLHGGEIEARSEGTGRGAEFVLRLPVKAGASRRAAEKQPTVLAA